MNQKKTLLVISSALLLLAACNKEVSFKYKATCNECKISYYDENGTFVSKEAHSGSFEKEISVSEFAPVMIALQSTIADSTALVTDEIVVELTREGKSYCSDTSSNGKKFQAVTCEYKWK